MYQIVIYLNGTSGMVKSSKITELVRCGELIAVLGPNGWAEVRRKIDVTYNHENRRQTRPDEFYGRFYF